MYYLSLAIKVTYILLVTNTWFTETIASQAAAKANRRCLSEPSVLWSRELSTHPYTAAPLVADVDADGQLDIVLCSHGADIHVLKGRDGQIQPGWPQKLHHASVFASPIQFDVDGDGRLDIIITTSSGKLVSFDSSGHMIADKQYQLSNLPVRKNWYYSHLKADEDTIHDFIVDEETKRDSDVSYVFVDPHILATPVLSDVNADGKKEELVVSVSYYFDMDDYDRNVSKQECCYDLIVVKQGSKCILRGADTEFPQNLSEDDIENYLAGAVLIFNMTSFMPIYIKHLELTKVTAEYPGYVLFSPTVVDLHGNHSSLEIIVPTSAGQVHAFNMYGEDMDGFPRFSDSVMGQITAGDVNGDGAVELIVQDISGNVVCYSAAGDIVWETQVTGSMPSGSRLIHHDQQQEVDIILSSDDGSVYLLSGKTGETKTLWPFPISESLRSPPLIMPLPQHNTPAMVLIGSEGRLNIISLDRSTCRDSVELGEISHVPLVSHDLIKEALGLEILVAAADGTLVCVGSGKKSDKAFFNSSLHSWPSEIRSANSFAYTNGKLGVMFALPGTEVLEVTGNSFTVTYTIIDDLHLLKPGNYYQVNIYFGNERIYSRAHIKPGDHSPVIPSPRLPRHGHMVIEMKTRHGEVFQDTVAAKVHMTILEDLKWIMLGPAIGTTVLLLFLHGFPSTSPLPLSVSSKNL